MIGPWVLRDILVVTTMSSGESQTCLPLQSWSVSVYMVHLGFYSCSLGILGRLIPRVVSMGVRKMTCNMSQRHPLWLVVLWPVTNKKKRWMPGNGTSNQGYRWSKRRQVGKLQVTAGRVQKNGTAWEGSGHLICKLTDVTQKELTGQRHTEGDPYCRKLLAFRAQSKVVSSHPCWASFWDGCPYAPASKICQSLFFPRSCNVGSTKTSFFKIICCTTCLHPSKP